MYEDEDLNDLYEDELTPEEVFAMTTVNRVKKCKVHVELKDKDGDVVSLPDTISNILNFINNKMEQDELGNNQFLDQIFPLMTHSVVSGLGRMLGIHQTALMLTQDSTKNGIIYMMCVAFLLLKFVQNNNLKIHTYEEPITDEEIEAIDRKAKANKVATLGALTGMDPTDILNELYSKGDITKEDLESLLGDDKKVL